MSWVEHSSDGIGNADRHYTVLKVRTRRQWALMRHDRADYPAAYFKTEGEARLFADTFGLTITDHKETQ